MLLTSARICTRVIVIPSIVVVVWVFLVRMSFGAAEPQIHLFLSKTIRSESAEHKNSSSHDRLRLKPGSAPPPSSQNCGKTCLAGSARVTRATHRPAGTLDAEQVCSLSLVRGKLVFQESHIISSFVLYSQILQINLQSVYHLAPWCQRNLVKWQLGRSHIIGLAGNQLNLIKKDINMRRHGPDPFLF